MRRELGSALKIDWSWKPGIYCEFDDGTRERYIDRFLKFGNLVYELKRNLKVTDRKHKEESE